MIDVQNFVRFCESEFGTAVMEREAAYIEQYLAPEDRVLDVGCGIGALEERLPKYEIVGLDRSQAMIRTAWERVSAPFVLGDATALPVATGAVDAFVSVATLEFIPDIDAVLAEAVRILDTDGTFVALILNTRSEYVRSGLRREGSYFQRLHHRDTDALTDTIFEYIDGDSEYFLGVADRTVIESKDPTTAAIVPVVGTPAR
ncbi:class I SAM-dependent methyltransferase [Halobellus ordinarius]|uniref:class I SAM-dependent methyltransferase n=1 Tax=Halobellus ordinarius TaxID=3075120 RepID=UPI0028801E3A|nr:methyltransferase domain-containing protein [Halobellus sp. ZY16]